MIDLHEVFDPLTRKNHDLHQLKQSGVLYKQKEEYKKEKIPEFYEACKTKPFADIFYQICTDQNINIVEKQNFVYFIDYIYVLDEVRGYQFGNLTPNYKILLDHGIQELKYNNPDSRFCEEYNKVLDGMEILVKRILEKLAAVQSNNKVKKIEWFQKIIDQPSQHFDEALQRILFVNQIMWQTDHRLIGLGSLDDCLYCYYKNDLESGYLNRQDVLNLLREFLSILHQYYWYKSNMLMGDTGQIIVLGGTKEDGAYRCNELTEMLIQIVEELQLPDPKLILRVNRNMSQELLKKAVLCMASGVGSPLLSNDETVIPALLEFGVDKEDAYQYTVSACWEPLIGGKSASLNNMTTLNYMRALENLFKREKLERLTTFDEFVEAYLQYLSRNMNAVKRVVRNAKFQYDPILSVFIEGCRENRKDISCGGAKYMNAGITSVALGNVIDSLLNIKELVYEKKKLTLLDVKKMIILNYEGYEREKEMLKHREKRYACDNQEVIALVRKILKKTTEDTIDFRTQTGGKLKFGLSAPTYVDAAKDMLASFDGRDAGKPYVVHISNESINSYTKILNFASALDYRENRFNGNVIDLMLNPGFLKENLDKILIMLYTGIKSGIFQLQMNVISSDVLIAAKNNPDAYLNLVVRVWGFSAYFNDLPEEYKNVLIDRALRNERKNQGGMNHGEI